jgi:hypothetical protein
VRELSLRIRAGNLELFGSHRIELTAGLPALHELPEGLSLVAQARQGQRILQAASAFWRLPAPCFRARGKFVCLFCLSKLLHARFISEETERDNKICYWGPYFKPGQLSRYSDGLRAGLPRFDSWQAQEICLFSTASRPAVGPAQPRTLWMPEAHSPGVERQRREVDQLPPSSAEAENGEAIPPLPQTSSWRSD